MLFVLTQKYLCSSSQSLTWTFRFFFFFHWFQHIFANDNDLTATAAGPHRSGGGGEEAWREDGGRRMHKEMMNNEWRGMSGGDRKVEKEKVRRGGRGLGQAWISAFSFITRHTWTKLAPANLNLMFEKCKKIKTMKGEGGWIWKDISHMKALISASLPRLFIIRL